MAGTRSSTGKARDSSSNPKNEGNTARGSKRKAADATSIDSNHESKKQMTIEATFGKEKDKDVPADSKIKGPSNDSKQSKKGGNESSSESERDLSSEDNGSNTTSKAQDNEAIKKSPERKEKEPSSILEKGVIYFFTRKRVGIHDAEGVGDLARTYFLLRPLPAGAKLEDGALPDLKNNRLLALPKKSFPKSHRDRFMAFVEMANTTIQDLKDNFMKGEDYETKTMGTRHIGPIITIAEGVYAINRTENRTTHLAYALTIPSDLGEVQKDLGLQDQGSFIISVKNPDRSAPANTTLPEAPQFPTDIIDGFRGLAWGEVKPRHLDYVNCQILLIGEKLESAVEPTGIDKKHDKETPLEELEQLEYEDELRVEHLNGDDSIFDDLKIRKKEYPKVPTTW